VNVNRLAAIAEIISSIAIVVTLVYLTIETRQNTDALLANSRQAALNGDLAIMSNAIDHPDVGRALFNAAADVPDDEIRHRALLISFLRVREFVWSQYKAGLMDEDAWQSYIRPVSTVFAAPAERAVLDQFRGDEEFIAYVQEFLDNNANAP
jgi:hypothetical protein